MATKKKIQNEEELLLEAMNDPLLWAENFLIGPDKEEPFKANYTQRAILQCKKNLVVIRVHRRAGKSVSLAILAIWSCCVKENYQVLILGPQQDHINEICEKITKFIEMSPFVREMLDKKNNIDGRNYFFKTGSTIKGRTMGTTSGNAGLKIRGKGADLIIIDEAAYLSERDFASLTPMIEGDQYREAVRLFAASTPTSEQGEYYRWCKSPECEGSFDRVHISFENNPDISLDRVARARALTSERSWIVEYLAEFPDIDVNAFRNTDIEKAKKPFLYADSRESIGRYPIMMGVDWDKYQAGVNIVVARFEQDTATYRIIYREEIPRTEFTLTKAVNRVIELNAIYQPEKILVDRGYGEVQVEQLRLHGKNNPYSFLDKRVVGVSFSENVEIKDPIFGTVDKKPFKSFMVNLLLKLFEDGAVEYSDKDTETEFQLKGYKIISTQGKHIKTTSKNEHIIDAMGLAFYGLFMEYHNTIVYKRVDVDPIVLKAPVHTPSLNTIRHEKELYKDMRRGYTDKSIYKEMGRGTLGSKPITRTKF